jgi:hypothetical protein
MSNLTALKANLAASNVDALTTDEMANLMGGKHGKGKSKKSKNKKSNKSRRSRGGHGGGYGGGHGGHGCGW